MRKCIGSSNNPLSKNISQFIIVLIAIQILRRTLNILEMANLMIKYVSKYGYYAK